MAAPTLLNGNDISIYVNDTTFKLLVCAQEASLSMSTDVTEVTTKCSAGNTDQEAGKRSWSMSFSGVMDNVPDATEVSFTALWGWWNSGSKKTYAFKNAGDSVYYAGEAIITALDITANVNEQVSFSCTLTGTGALDNTP